MFTNVPLIFVTRQILCTDESHPPPPCVNTMCVGGLPCAHPQKAIAFVYIMLSCMYTYISSYYVHIHQFILCILFDYSNILIVLSRRQRTKCVRRRQRTKCVRARESSRTGCARRGRVECLVHVSVWNAEVIFMVIIFILFRFFWVNTIKKSNKIILLHVRKRSCFYFSFCFVAKNSFGNFLT